MYSKLEDSDLENTLGDTDYSHRTRRGKFSWAQLAPCVQVLTLFLLIFQSIVILIFCIPKASLPCLQVSESKNGDYIPTQFHSDMRYQSLDHKYDHLWNETAGSGMVKSSEGLEDGLEELGSISTFHQLHCLAGLRKALQDAREGKQVAFDWREDTHWPHCLDILRKTVLCLADGTIERKDRSRNGTLLGGISGAEDWRQCRDTRLLYELRERKGILNTGIPSSS